MRIVVCTGGFDPLHEGHISYLTEAAQLGDRLIVGVNSDAWLIRKKGRALLPWKTRQAVLAALKPVSAAIEFNDDDGSGTDAIRRVRAQYPGAHIVFANGGDRAQHNCPELSFQDPNLSFVWAVGGDTKQNSSSWILANYEKNL